MTKHAIDCDADPFIPEGWKVESHSKQGKIEWKRQMCNAFYV